MDSDKYGLTYVVGTSKTYVVQPTEGELPYELAEKKPAQFYKKVMNQNVKEHSVAKSPPKQRRSHLTASGELPVKKRKVKGSILQYKNKICKRSVARILNIVQAKMRRMISFETKNRYRPEEIQRAMSNPAAEQLLKRQITEGSVKLVKQES